ncbi:carboxypeptidase regulatory-like domain-containing protein [Clavibacter tessellarius]|uniref:carboxypeptidase regulatory-like domain-containing protein n=1 Tax=Clavibacter tessellarius TaxID=31965 RepID=UPI00324A8EF7
MQHARRRALVGLLSLALVASAQAGLATGASAAPASGSEAAAAPAALAFTAAPAPTVTGTTEVGSTLTAVTGTWTPTPGTFLYRWSRDGVAIQGATRATYALVAADQGKRITVSVTAVKTRYPSTTRTSEPTAPVAPKGGAPVAALPFTSAPVPTLSGSVTVGGTVTAVPGTWSPTPRLAYQWFAGSAPIAGATSSTYSPVAQDLGKTLTVSVAAFRDGYATTTRMSAGATVTQGTFPERTFVIRGDARVGEHLDVANETFSYEATQTVTWAADGVTIPGATTVRYQPVVADIGKRITATITGSAPGFATETRTTTPTAPVVAADTPPAVATGVVAGRAFLGSVADANLLGDGEVTAYRESDGVGWSAPLVDGSFEVTGLAPGEYTLVVGSVVDGTYVSQFYRAPGDAATATRFTVANDRTVRLDVVVETGASISGTITTSDGKPAFGSEVEVFRARGGAVASIRTDESGAFLITSRDLTPGQYEVRISALREPRGLHRRVVRRHGRPEQGHADHGRRQGGDHRDRRRDSSSAAASRASCGSPTRSATRERTSTSCPRPPRCSAATRAPGPSGARTHPAASTSRRSRRAATTCTSRRTGTRHRPTPRAGSAAPGRSRPRPSSPHAAARTSRPST